MAYRFIAFLFGLTAEIFYRRIVVGGRVPESGPVLMVANHPNALADPAILLRITSRPLRTLAKEPLFRMPVVSWILRAARAIPVYRAQDGYDTARNAEVFRAVRDALTEGEVVALFPEGISHHLPGLQRLKTGAARMAIDATRGGGAGARLQILPVGLTFRDKPAFRSDAIVHIGEPLDVAAFLAARSHDGSGHDEDREAVSGDDGRSSAGDADEVTALTLEMQRRIQALIIDLDRWEDSPLIEVAALWSAGNRQDPLAAILVARAARVLERSAPDALARFKERLLAFSALLRARGLDASHLDLRLSLGVVLQYLVRHGVAFVLGLPVGLLGAAAYGLPYLVLRWGPGLARVEPDAVATVRIFGAVFVMLPWHAGICALLAALWPTTVALPLSIALPFAGLYAHAFMRRRKRMWRDGRAFWHLATRPSLRQALLRERDELTAELRALAERL